MGKDELISYNQNDFLILRDFFSKSTIQQIFLKNDERKEKFCLSKDFLNYPIKILTMVLIDCLRPTSNGGLM